MTLTRSEFLVLRELCEHGTCSPHALASSAGLTEGAANEILESCARDMLVEDGAIAGKGVEALEPYRVENAVIMAAGVSSRFAPISYEMPKGLLRVRGEVLVERQIRQLREAGIDDITLIVGYLGEQFSYLEHEFDVDIVANPDYLVRNNNSSLWHVRDRLSNTYICSSDDYFTENPFERYVYKAYYAAEYAEGPTREWCLALDQRDRIVGVTIGGSDAWYMLGHAYFDRAFSKRFVEVLGEEYDLPETAEKLWEQIYADHVGEFDMEVRRYHGTIHEFDSLDEACGFDPGFIDEVDSSVLDNIAATLACTRRDVRGIEVLEQGLTNMSFKFDV
ncbi:MAG TPA: NTP transferase domain-containing protein, partial [Atopobiaceae bacterium]|nr:NTP transferase domain-containing protein [Atopobiaceae bacterium]